MFLDPFYDHILLWILTTWYIMKGPMQKNYKIPSMHQFSNHISKKLRSGYTKLAPNNVNTFYFVIGQHTKNHFVV
jgi:hypothetical protein